MKIAMMYSEEMSAYDFGIGHPFRGDRYGNFMRFFREMMLDEKIDVVEPKYATNGDLMLVHDADYIEYIEKSAKIGEPLYGDTPILPGMDKAAKLIAGSSMMAGELVADGDFDSTVGLGGGMHHASFSREAGFCIFNDVAICAKNLLLRKGLKRVLILDTDAHAGDGTSEIFYDDPSVLFISIHQDPHTLYPGRCFAYEIGADDGEGYNVNVPIPPRSSYRSYEYILDEIFVPLAMEFRPDIIIRNGGSDPHFADELTELGLTLEGFKMIGMYVREVADEVCDGKVVDLPGSGYNPIVLPCAWTSLICGMAGIDVELEEPVPVPGWLSDVKTRPRTEKVVDEVKVNLRSYWSF
jgi:acetoin utilization protein AcuC